MSASFEPCHICRKPITDLMDFLLLNSVDLRDSPAYIFAHGRCADESGPYALHYSIELARILAARNSTEGDYNTESLEAWRIHLRGKNWFTREMEKGLEAAHALARRIAGRTG